MKKSSYQFLFLFSLVCCFLPKHVNPSQITENSTSLWDSRAAEVAQAAHDAFQAYLRHAAWHDDLAPVSRAGIATDIHARATLFDSLSTLHVMGLRDDFQRGVDLLHLHSALSSENPFPAYLAALFPAQGPHFLALISRVSAVLPAAVSLPLSAVSHLLSHLLLPPLPSKLFEYHIRVLGGLLGAYSLSGHRSLLVAATESADALVHAFSLSLTPVPVPHARVLSARRQPLRWAMARALDALRFRLDPSGMLCNSLAGIGSFGLELRWLSRETGDPKYAEAATKITDWIESIGNTNNHKNNNNNNNNIMITNNHNDVEKKDVEKNNHIDVVENNKHTDLALETKLIENNNVVEREPEITSPWLPRVWSTAPPGYHGPDQPECPPPSYVARLGTGGDSYYEYILKEMLLFPEDPQVQRRFRRRYQKLARASYTEFSAARFSHFTCFAPGMLALGADQAVPEAREKHLRWAEEMMQRCLSEYWRTPTGISRDDRGDARYPLRPETLESLFVLHRVTRKPEYRQAAWRIWQSLKQHCHVSESGGFSGLLDVEKRQQKENWDDHQHSYFISEALKYLYLTFQEDQGLLSFDQFVFTTEGHPLLRHGERCPDGKTSDCVPARHWLLWSLADGWWLEWLFILWVFSRLVSKILRLFI